MIDVSRQPRRIQLSRKRGFNLEEASKALNGLDAVKVDRTTPWGNPFRVVKGAGSVKVVDAFYRWLLTDEAGKALAERAKKELRGKNLACWCDIESGQPCHADRLIEVANS